MGKAVKAVKNIVKKPASLLNPVAAIGTAAAAGGAKDAAKAAGVDLGLPKAKPGTGEYAAQAIRTQPFNIESQTEASKTQANLMYEFVAEFGNFLQE